MPTRLGPTQVVHWQCLASVRSMGLIGAGSRESREFESGRGSTRIHPTQIRGRGSYTAWPVSGDNSTAPGPATTWSTPCDQLEWQTGTHMACRGGSQQHPTDAKLILCPPRRPQAGARTLPKRNTMIAIGSGNGIKPKQLHASSRLARLLRDPPPDPEGSAACAAAASFAVWCSLS
jgi:hypothetical protein